MKKLEDIAESVCAGCGVCGSFFGEEKVDIGYNSKGFLRPVLKKPLTNDETRSFNEICPSVNAKIEKTENYDLHWGPINNVYGGYSTNGGARFKGASGGALSGIAIHLLKTNKVEGIVHIGASKTSPLENEYKQVLDTHLQPL